jgi:glycosyltransferase involved in cell wall biosynthesis
MTLGWNSGLESPIDGLFPDTMDSLNCGLISQPYGCYEREAFSRDTNDLKRIINDSLFRQALGVSRSRHVLFSSLMETDETNFVLPCNLNYAPFATSYAIVYDIIPYLFKDAYLPHESFAAKYMAHLEVKLSADVLFAISEKSRQDLINALGVPPKKVVTISTGIDLRAFKGAKTPKKQLSDRYGLRSPFIFFLGGDEFRKNLTGYVKCLPYLDSHHRQNLQLLIGGPVSETTKVELRAIARSAGLAPDMLIFAGFMSHEDLLSAYQNCAVAAVPSVYEGFGLPVLEAVACGAPVIASQNSSMSEILTDPAFLFDPGSSSDMARKTQYALESIDHVRVLKATYKATLAKYQWKYVAETILTTFAETESQAAPTGIRGFRFCGEDRDVVMLGLPGADGLSCLRQMGAEDIIRIYASPNILPELQTLPYRLDDIASLNVLAGEPAQIVCFVNDTDDFWRLAQRSDPAQCMLIFANEVILKACEEMMQQQGKRNRHMKAATAFLQNVTHIWVAQGDNLLGYDILFSSVGIQKSAHATTMSFMTAVRSEAERYRASNPYASAQKLRHCLRKENSSMATAKTLAKLAAVAIFDRRKLV